MYLITSLNVWDQYVSLYVRAQEFYVGEANCTFKVKTNIMGFRKFTSFLWQQPGNQFKIMKHCLYNNSTCEC